jgi:hypothetical protein
LVLPLPKSSFLSDGDGWTECIAGDGRAEDKQRVGGWHKVL